MEEVTQGIAALGVVPVIAIEDAAKALPLADALIEGGLPIAEITFRTEAAAAAIEAIASARPELLLGAGTVLDKATLRRARDAGAVFALAPGLSPSVVQDAKRQAYPFFPGVMTPTDIQAAIDLGATRMKFFPAGPAGGLDLLEAMAAPYAHLGLAFNPTGGVNPDNLARWLGSKQVFAAGGSWIATRGDLAEDRFDAIRDKAKAAAAIAREARAQAS